MYPDTHSGPYDLHHSPKKDGFYLQDFALSIYTGPTSYFMPRMKRRRLKKILNNSI
jgi:hypothetical protein